MRRWLSVSTSVAALLLAGSPVSASAATDEDQVRAVLDGMNASYNQSDFAGFAAHLCADLLSAAGFAADWYQSRRADGPTRITVNSVSLAGTPREQVAVANVRFEAANRDDTKTMDVEFVRDGAEWKACSYDAGQAV